MESCDNMYLLDVTKQHAYVSSIQHWDSYKQVTSTTCTCLLCSNHKVLYNTNFSICPIKTLCSNPLYKARISLTRYTAYQYWPLIIFNPHMFGINTDYVHSIYIAVNISTFLVDKQSITGLVTSWLSSKVRELVASIEQQLEGISYELMHEVIS